MEYSKDFAKIIEEEKRHEVTPEEIAMSRREQKAAGLPEHLLDDAAISRIVQAERASTRYVKSLESRN